MNVIATALIDGPEAKGMAEIIEENGQRILRFQDGFWVAPGAPDVTLTFSPDPRGTVDNRMIEIGMYDYKNPKRTIGLSNELDIDMNTTLIVYCKQFQVHFGHGTFSFN